MSGKFILGMYVPSCVPEGLSLATLQFNVCDDKKKKYQEKNCFQMTQKTWQ